MKLQHTLGLLSTIFVAEANLAGCSAAASDETRTHDADMVATGDICKPGQRFDLGIPVEGGTVIGAVHGYKMFKGERRCHISATEPSGNIVDGYVIFNVDGSTYDAWIVLKDHTGEVILESYRGP